MVVRNQDLVVSCRRDAVDGMNHPQIIEYMARLAKEEGCVPDDFNWAGLPNIYLRAEYGIYDDGTERWHHDILAMRVKKIAE